MVGRTAVLDVLRRRVDGKLRRDCLMLQARYAESLSWLAEEAGLAAEALFWTDRAAQWAQRCGWGAMTGYTFIRRSMMAVSFAGDGRQAVDHAQAAIEAPDVPVRIRGLAAKQLAFGHALSKDADASARALDHAMELLAQPSDDETNALGQRSVVSDDLHNIFRATCDIYLGRGEQGIAVLEPRLVAVSDASPRTAAITTAKLAGAYANIGQPDEAARFTQQALDNAIVLQSLSTKSELRRIAPVLHRWSARDDVAQVLDRLRDTMNA